jgi:hypothetical protein
MLVREIITPQKESFTMRIPREMIGKTVEVIAFEISDNTPAPGDKAKRLLEIEALTKNTLINLSSFKFDRDQANNYDE